MPHSFTIREFALFTYVNTLLSCFGSTIVYYIPNFLIFLRGSKSHTHRIPMSLSLSLSALRRFPTCYFVCPSYALVLSLTLSLSFPLLFSLRRLPASLVFLKPSVICNTKLASKNGNAGKNSLYL